MARLAKDVLAEIPDQLLSFMKSRGIEPRPALSSSPLPELHRHIWPPRFIFPVSPCSPFLDFSFAALKRKKAHPPACTSCPLIHSESKQTHPIRTAGAHPRLTCCRNSSVSLPPITFQLHYWRPQRLTPDCNLLELTFRTGCFTVCLPIPVVASFIADLRVLLKVYTIIYDQFWHLSHCVQLAAQFGI